jgi:putative nucleotidyltransferase with HDIG domain
MSIGKRRPKSARATLRPANPIDIHRDRDAQRRVRLVVLGLVVGSVLLASAIVHGTGPPFSFRVGQRPSRELRVNVAEFHRKDPLKTNSDRQASEAKVAPRMSHDPEPIRELAEQLDDLVDAVVAAPTREALPEEIRSAWDLDPPTFAAVKAASDTPARREDLLRQIAKAFEPLIRDGVLGPQALPPSEESHLTLLIRQPGIPGPGHEVHKDRLLPERIKKPEGAVAKEFTGAFRDNKLGQSLFAMVADRLRGTPTLKYEEPATVRDREAARARVKDAFKTFHAGDILVAQDERITDDHLALLRLEHETSVSNQTWVDRCRRAGSVVIVVAALFALIGHYVLRNQPKLVQSPRRMAELCGLIVVALGVARLLAAQPWDAELIPVVLTSMILAIAYGPQFAVIVGFTLALMTSMALDAGLGHFFILMGGMAVAVLPLGEVRTRTKPIKVGIFAGLGFLVLTWAVGLFEDQPLDLVASDGFWRGIWGLMTGFFLGGSLPFVEKSFGLVTGISLLELGDITHPLLQELVRRAPGTHNHSVTVGTIAEAAAERIGANALLVRIGAYFHDIGKMMKPHYFVENQAGATNRHANLAPAMSTLIIIGHVKDGVELGRQHHLPEPIIDLIEQHHGTTLVEYFYREAERRAGGDPCSSAVMESSFRYPGPKPQTKEAGILMIADCVESASRTLSEPMPARIDSLVNELVRKRLDDGQFDECGLTLREIAEIRESLIKSLIGIYHGRVKYPEQKTA